MGVLGARGVLKDLHSVGAVTLGEGEGLHIPGVVEVIGIGDSAALGDLHLDADVLAAGVLHHEAALREVGGIHAGLLIGVDGDAGLGCRLLGQGGRFFRLGVLPGGAHHQGGGAQQHQSQRQGAHPLQDISFHAHVVSPSSDALAIKSKSSV